MTGKKIGIALGGGSARGLAHIGVLKVLEENHIYPDIITGTSIGSIVGALYAGGHKPAELEQLVLRLNWKKLISLVDVTFPLSGLFQGKRVVSLIKSILGNLTFQQLNHPFACVATDIINGEQVVFKEGSLIEAIRASISIPGIFTPVSFAGRYLVDGGLVNTVPVSVCREMGAEFVIGVNVIPEPGKTMCNPNNTQQYPVCQSSELSEVNGTSGIQGRTMQSHIDDVYSATRKFLISHRPVIRRTKNKTDEHIEGKEKIITFTKIPRLIDVLSQTVTIAEYHVAVENLKDADIAISPEVEQIGFWHYHNGAQAIKAGELAARKALTKYDIAQIL